MELKSLIARLDGVHTTRCCIAQASASGISGGAGGGRRRKRRASLRSFSGHTWLSASSRRICRNGIAGFEKRAPRQSVLGTESPVVLAAALPKDHDSEMTASGEKSESANEELLLFFFQLDLTTRLQRALNLDQYEVAQQIREALVGVDQEIARQKEARSGSASSKDEAQDKAIIILRLRNELQKAVDDENYGGAAELRDQISKLEAESLAAAATAMVYETVQYAFRLGQKVRHLKFGYQGVICGMDPLCCESHTSFTKNLARKQNQPFYQVLVDVKDEPNLLVAYVAEENLTAMQELDKDRFDHPYISFLFYGMDSAGDYIPIKQLREKYGKPRHELPWDEEKDNNTEPGGGLKP